MYDVIGEPPLNDGAAQVIVTLMLVLTEVDGVSGASGFVIITAPLPAGDKAELPKAFVAYTFAKMLAPHRRLNGAACRIEIGTVQLVVVDTLQFDDSTVNVTPSLCLKSTV